MATYWIDISTAEQSHDPTPDTYITRYKPEVNTKAASIAAIQDDIKVIQQDIPIDAPLIDRYRIGDALRANRPDGGKSSQGIIPW